MNVVMDMLVVIILLALAIGVWVGLIVLIRQPEIKPFLPKFPSLPRSHKPNAVVFDGEPKTEEEIAIEREERILKTIGSEK